VTGEVRSIREDEIEECLALWKTVWPHNPPGYFERYFFGDQNFQPEYTRVCIVDGRITSTAHIVKRIVCFGDFTLTMGGVANVATLSDYRGKGYASDCLRSAIEILEADAFDFSVLFTHNHGHYSRLGWEVVSTLAFVGTIKPTIARPYGHTVVRPYEERDDPALHLLHFGYNAHRPMSVRRTEPYWRDWIGWWRGISPGKAVIAEDEGAPVGYALYHPGDHPKPTHIREFAVRQGAESALGPLLERVVEDSRRHGAGRVVLPLYSDPHVRAAADALFLEVNEVTADSAMIRFLHQDDLLVGLAPELNERWMQAGAPPGRLVFDGPYGAVSVASVGGFLRVEREDGPEPDALSQAELFHLLAGRGMRRELPDAARTFADALLPAAHGWFWELDGF
jgi:GNAT superfamily N-acetyltransferase